MSLIKCLECGHEISDQAPSCPHCGYVFTKESVIVNDVNKVDLNISRIEKTDKKWKKFKALGLPLAIIGLIMVRHGANSAAFVFGFLFAIIGFGLLVVSSVGNWWDRG